MGTGTMLLGLASASPQLLNRRSSGIPVLKGMNDLSALFRIRSSCLRRTSRLRDIPCLRRVSLPAQRARCRILPHWHFGGYARLSQELLDFMNRFYTDTGIPSPDFVYTGKLFTMPSLDMIRQLYFSARLPFISHS